MDRVYYSEILDNDEMVEIGLLLKEFKNGTISYVDFGLMMKKLGYELSVELVSPKQFKLLRDVEAFKERVENNSILSKDVSLYQAKNKDGILIDFRYDRAMIEALASFGNEEAIFELEGIKRFEARNGGVMKK